MVARGIKHMSLGNFNANEVPPEQGGSKHPIGMFPFQITSTDVVSTKDNTGGMFAVELTSPAGKIVNNYNLWNQSSQAVEIARKQLSALCHAVGILQLNFDNNKGRELVGGVGTMEISWQKGQEPGSEKGGPNGGYVEVKKVFDAQGNEPGKVKAQPQTQAPQNNFNQQPMQQQPGGGWGNAAPATAPATAPAAPNQAAPAGWGNQPQQAQPGPNPPAGGFTPTPNAAPPPWGQR